MESVVQYGRRRGSSKRVSSAEEPSRGNQPPDLRQVTVLTKGEWQRIQDELNRVNKDKESMKEAAKQREALHVQSTEVVKKWSNTIAGQRQKKLEAKKVREEAEEEKRKTIDKEEAKYQEQHREEAIEKAKTQIYFQTNHVKGLHSALLLTEVLKEREAQIELKQRITSASEDVDKELLDLAKTSRDEALRQEQEKALQKKLEGQAVAGDLKNQMKEREQVREQEKIENRKDREETQRLQQLYHWEQKMEEERQAKLRRSLMNTHLEHVANRDLIKATHAQKQEAEEEQRKLFLSAKQKMMKLRKEKEKELFNEAQMRREWIMTKLTVTQQEQTANEEQRVAKAVAERDEKLAQQKRKEEEKKAAMLESIAAHREFMQNKKEQEDKTTKQDMLDRLQAKKEADRIFTEKQQMEAQKIKADGRNIHEFNATQMAEKRDRLMQLRREEQEFQEKQAETEVKEENQFQRYSQNLINAAAEAQRNVFPLCKAAGEGIGAGLCPVSSYLVQDKTGGQMPKYVSGATQNVEKLNGAKDIHQAKRRLGFTWS
ncbi:hypothetical protein PBY51_022408 [Eleginops maclovinus]|uniref:Trichohyalin-plectin-homology domain-containing protein n=1 Tax=Eleginops maclovinus TaxID=56733 RepID=A0AAN7XF77_ELEMC|nr:hypothetical protein PBY51_022408 [Eleginops maclovinus]